VIDAMEASFVDEAPAAPQPAESDDRD